MEEKIFELIQNMYADLKQEIGKVSNNVIKIEQEHGAKLDALLDGYKQLTEGQEEIKSQIADIQKHMVH